MIVTTFIERGITVNNIRNFSFRLLNSVALGLFALSLSAAPVLAVAAAPGESKDVKADWALQRQEWLKLAIDRMADRLEIKASQQNAWQAYTKVLETAMQHPAKPAESKSDAASITRMHADMAAARAQKLAQIADATAKFQEVLGPDQRKTFDQMVAHFVNRHMHRFHGGDGAGREGHDGHQHD
jgi:hypothetical protein